MARSFRVATVGVTLLALAVPVGHAAADPTGDAPSAGASGVGDPYFPLAGNGGYDAQHYHLDLRFDPVTGGLQGATTIRARAPQTRPRSTST